MSIDTCKEFRNDYSAYLDGELGDFRRDEVVSHLGGCEACSREMARLKQGSGVLRQAAERCGDECPDLWSALAARLPSVCELVQDDFSAYLDGELIPPAKEGVSEHLQSCQPCHERFQDMSRVTALISRGLELPPSMPLDIWSSVSHRLTEDCSLIGEELSSFYDREVSADRHRSVTAHLLECADCRDQLSLVTHTGDLLQNLYQPDLPEDFDLWPLIKNKIKVVPFGHRERKRRTLLHRRLYATAAVIAVGVLASIALFVNFHSVDSIQPVTAESYLIESALGEPAELAEAVVYEN